MGRLTECARQISGAFSALSWYSGSLMGDNHYRRYVALRARTHPDEPVCSEREYWVMRHEATEKNPQSRCC